MEVAVFAAAAELELGLVMNAVEGVDSRPGAWLQPGIQGSPRNVPKLLERRDPRVHQCLRLHAPHPGDKCQVVVIHTLLPAHVAEVADPAVARRPPVRLWLLVESGKVPLADAPVVRLELDNAECLPLPETAFDVDALDRLSRDPRDLLRVEHQLQHVCRLGGASELRVDRLVPAVRLLLEEVAEAAPRSVSEVWLIDDVR